MGLLVRCRTPLGNHCLQFLPLLRTQLDPVLLLHHPLPSPASLTPLFLPIIHQSNSARLLERVHKFRHSRGCGSPTSVKPGQHSYRSGFCGFLLAEERRGDVPNVNTPQLTTSGLYRILQSCCGQPAWPSAPLTKICRSVLCLSHPGAAVRPLRFGDAWPQPQLGVHEQPARARWDCGGCIQCIRRQNSPIPTILKGKSCALPTLRDAVLPKLVPGC